MTLNLGGVSLTFSLAVFLLTLEVSASPPPAEFIAGEVAKKRSNLALVRVNFELKRLEDGTPVGETFVEEVEYDYRTKKMAFRIRVADGPVLLNRFKDLSGTIGLSMKPLSPAQFLFFDDRPEEVVTTLIRSGLPIPTQDELKALETEEERRLLERSSVIKRWQGKKAWVIRKATSTDPEKMKSAPQLWVEKDAFLPLRLIWNSDQGSEAIEVQWSDYRADESFFYPTSTVLYRGGQGVLLAQVKNSLVIPKKSKKLKKNSPSVSLQKEIGSSGIGWTEAGLDLARSEREWLEFYLRTMR